MTPANWMEVTFNVTYLLVIFGLVFAMSVKLTDDVLQHRLRNGFLLLALGDTGHVGFRTVALLRGGLESRVDVLGLSVPLVGVGALSTAITVTLLYLLLLDAWRLRFKAARSGLSWGLAAMVLVRFALFLPPQNEWGNVVPPWGWSVLRNVPLMALGLGVAGLMVRDGRRANDATFTTFGWLIVGSYAFYLPVILFVQRAPMIGMLMIPKTLMYLAMAWLAWARLFKGAGVAPRVATVP